MKTSTEGVNQIKLFEGFRALPYKDSGGKLTVGYGHLIVPGDGCVAGSPIAASQATGLLVNDLAEAELIVNKFVTVPLEQHQFDALVSFVYNLGGTNFAHSTLLVKLNKGDFVGAAAEFPKWDHVNGVPNQGILNRRNREQDCFVNGVYYTT